MRGVFVLLSLAGIGAIGLSAPRLWGGTPGADGAALCIEFAGSHTCDRKAADESSRGPAPSIADDPNLDRAAAQISTAVNRPGCVIAPSSQACVGANVPHEPTQQDVDDSHEALTRLGYSQAVVRLARAGDPAVEGVVLAGVRVGDGCVLSVSTRQYSGANTWSAGLLRDGSCLTA